MASTSALLIICVQHLEDVFLKFPGAEGCFREELREVVCRLPVAEAPDSSKSGLEAGTAKQGVPDRMRFPDTVLNFTPVAKTQILSLFLIALSSLQAEDKVRSCVLHGRMALWPLYPESQSCPTPCHCVTVK